jgi:hypothetical protein
MATEAGNCCAIFVARGLCEDERPINVRLRGAQNFFFDRLLAFRVQQKRGARAIGRGDAVRKHRDGNRLRQGRDLWGFMHSAMHAFIANTAPPSLMPRTGHVAAVPPAEGQTERAAVQQARTMCAAARDRTTP